MGLRVACLLTYLHRLSLATSEEQYYAYGAPFAPSTTNFLRRAQHGFSASVAPVFGASNDLRSAIVLGDYLYIDSGEIGQLVNDHTFTAPSKYNLDLRLTEAEIFRQRNLVDRPQHPMDELDRDLQLSSQ